LGPFGPFGPPGPLGPKPPTPPNRHEHDQPKDAYRYGYDVGKTGNFHHETRGPDGVTYGCYGLIDPYHLLRATHYVADAHGYRTVEPEKPVETFPPHLYSETNGGPSEPGIVLQWEELYFPIGCGKFANGAQHGVPFFLDDVRVDGVLLGRFLLIS